MPPEARWPRLHPSPSWKDRPLEDRARAVESACRTAMQLIDGTPDRAARLARIDPVPASTRALLRRLAARRRNG